MDICADSLSQRFSTYFGTTQANSAQVKSDSTLVKRDTNPQCPCPPAQLNPKDCHRDP